jgi:hypothetical protein
MKTVLQSVDVVRVKLAKESRRGRKTRLKEDGRQEFVNSGLRNYITLARW